MGSVGKETVLPSYALEAKHGGYVVHSTAKARIATADARCAKHDSAYEAVVHDGVLCIVRTAGVVDAGTW